MEWFGAANNVHSAVAPVRTAWGLMGRDCVAMPRFLCARSIRGEGLSLDPKAEGSCLECVLGDGMAIRQVCLKSWRASCDALLLLEARVVQREEELKDGTARSCTS